MSSNLERSARNAFLEAFGVPPTVEARAPGRVELLGNHTDYNDGLVLAVAIDRFTVVVGRPNEGPQARVRSVNFGGEDRFAVDRLEPGEPGSWARYVRGVVWALSEADGPVSGGFDAAIAGEVPLGAGLSSSASLQASVALFLLEAGLVRGSSSKLDDDSRLALARGLRRGENAFVGVQSGLLDQFAVLFGREGQALWLDCRSLEFERLPLATPPPSIVVCDSKTSRRLADGMYNRRRAECEQVASWFQERRGRSGVGSLRDVSLEELDASWGALDPLARRRARHVLTENERVRLGAEALRAGDLAGLGRLLSQSHASSRDDFENSAPALDALAEAAETSPGFLGGKLSGAGWAGCTVNLVEATRALDFAESVRRGFERRTGTVPDVHICQAAAGASSLRLESPPAATA